MGKTVEYMLTTMLTTKCGAGHPYIHRFKVPFPQPYDAAVRKATAHMRDDNWSDTMVKNAVLSLVLHKVAFRPVRYHREVISYDPTD